jgi:hypothetical protein
MKFCVKKKHSSLEIKISHLEIPTTKISSNDNRKEQLYQREVFDFSKQIGLKDRNN